jgi:hypothetical protein
MENRPGYWPAGIRNNSPQRGLMLCRYDLPDYPMRPEQTKAPWWFLPAVMSGMLGLTVLAMTLAGSQP